MDTSNNKERKIEYFYVIIIVYLMYFYAYFYSVNPFEYAKLIVGIVGIDGKSLLSKIKSLFSRTKRLLSKFWRLRKKLRSLQNRIKWCEKDYLITTLSCARARSRSEKLMQASLFLT